jgi:hypothetical protein
MSELSYIHIRRDARPRSMSLPPFKAILIAEYAVSSHWRNEVSRWLVRSGCLYCCTWGVDCKSWHDSVDHANMERFEGTDIADDRFVMTTWHDRDTLAEAMWFAAACAAHPTVGLQHTLIVHIGVRDRRRTLSHAYGAAAADADA